MIDPETTIYADGKKLGRATNVRISLGVSRPNSPRVSFDEKDFTPEQWRKLVNQARADKLCSRKHSKVPALAYAFMEENERLRIVRQFGPASAIKKL